MIRNKPTRTAVSETLTILREPAFRYRDERNSISRVYSPSGGLNFHVQDWGHLLCKLYNVISAWKKKQKQKQNKTKKKPSFLNANFFWIVNNFRNFHNFLSGCAQHLLKSVYSLIPSSWLTSVSRIARPCAVEVKLKLANDVTGH